MLINNTLIKKNKKWWYKHIRMAMSGEHFTYPCSAVYSTEFKTPFHWIKFIPLPAQNLFSYLIFPWLVNFGLLSTWNKSKHLLEKKKKCHLMVVIITSVCYICIGLMIRYPFLGQGCLLNDHSSPGNYLHFDSYLLN